MARVGIGGGAGDRMGGYRLIYVMETLHLRLGRPIAVDAGWRRVIAGLSMRHMVQWGCRSRL